MQVNEAAVLRGEGGYGGIDFAVVGAGHGGVDAEEVVGVATEAGVVDIAEEDGADGELLGEGVGAVGECLDAGAGVQYEALEEVVPAYSEDGDSAAIYFQTLSLGGHAA